MSIPRKFFFAAIMLVCVNALAAEGQALRAGAAVRVITPDPLLPVSGGIGTPKKTTEKKGDLFARALVLENGRVVLNYLQIGTAKILTIPGEALPNIGYYIKGKMNADHAFLFGLTNDAFGCMLTKVDFGSFKRYDYVSSTSLGEMTGEVFIDEVERWLAELGGYAKRATP